jgi:predicted dehydrogenase
MNFPFAQAKPIACCIEIGDGNSVGSLPTSVISFEPVNQYARQIERFSKYLLGETVAHWDIEDAMETLRTIEAIFQSAHTGGWKSLES